MFKPGSIRKIQVKNFVTYSYTEFHPGPNLNMIIGPNGTGKSTMVAAIILGLGGNPKVVGRGTKISEYVKHNCEDATIDIYLQGEAENSFIKIRRIFDIQDRSAFYLNNERVDLATMKQSISAYNIQVDNLCQFLPQDKVQDFAKMNKQELLRATQQALCRDDLIEKQESLISSKERHKQLETLLAKNEQKLTEAQDTNVRLEGRIQGYNKKKKYLSQIQHIDRKVAWLQYEEVSEKLQVVKEDKRKATQVYDNHKNAIRPMESEITKAKKRVVDFQGGQTEISSTIKNAERTVQSKLDSMEQFKNTINKVNQEMKVKIAEIDQRDEEIKRTVEQVENMVQQQKSLVDKFGNDEEVRNKVQKLSADIQKMTSVLSSTENRKDQLESMRSQKNAELRAIENEARRLENVKQSRMELLQRLDRDAYHGVLWLRNNKHLFKGEIYEPIMLELNVLIPEHAPFVESTIGLRDKIAFTCTEKSDMETLIRHLRVEQNLTINALHSPNIEQAFYPTVPIEQLRPYGLTAYIHSLFTAPVPIMNYLCRTYRVHNIPIGTARTNQMYEKVPREVQVFFSDRYRFSVSFSRYTNEKSTRQNEVQGDRTLSITLDVMRMEELRCKMESMRGIAGKCDNELREFNNQIHQITSTISKARDELKVLDSLKQQAKQIAGRIVSMRKRIDEMKTTNTTREQVRRQAKDKIDRICAQMVIFQREITKAFKSYSALLEKKNLVQLKIDDARKNVAFLENQINESRRLLQEAETTLNFVKSAYSDALGQAKASLQKAKGLSKGFTPDDDGFKTEFRAIYDKLPVDQRQLQKDRDEILSKIDCLNTADEGEIKEYEERLSLIENLQSDIQQGSIELNRIVSEMETLQEEWLVPLKELVTEINYRFASAFEKMACAGEVTVSTGDDEKDFKEYGLAIKVTYRSGEPMQELNTVVQSGGERAVATAAFMLSLQELTPVPFRCVDEINQGMDANNERRIFELLVECTTQNNTAQYFLITPKLVPHLKFTKNMMVHVVHNGPFIEADKKWSHSRLCNPQGVQVR